jgi:hypothetical protein
MDEEMRFHLDMEARRHMNEGMSEREARRARGGSSAAWSGIRTTSATSAARARSSMRWATSASRCVRCATGRSHRGGDDHARHRHRRDEHVFGVVKHALLTPLPYSQPGQLVGVWSAWKGFERTWLSYDEWEGMESARARRSPTSGFTPTLSDDRR